MSRRALAAVAVTALALAPFALPDAWLPPVPAGAGRAVHVVAFAVLAFAWTRARPQAWPWVVAAGVAVALGVEAVQRCCIDGRGAQRADVVADLVGLALGLAAAGAAHAVRKRRSGGAGGSG